MKRILYYSLVDWDWIKQRPQFIALGLAEHGLDVRVVYLWQYRRKNLKKINPEKLALRPVYRIPPFGGRFNIINTINKWLVRRQLEWEVAHFQPDAIWLSHPSQYEDIPGDYFGQIIYDCMDDYNVLGALPQSREKICRLEESLCARANLIFVSSSFLYKKICSLNPDIISRVHLIRNGCNGKLFPRISRRHDKKLCVGYVGTIAEWFDFNLIIESLEKISNLEYYLIGPICIKNAPIHERIHYLGTIAHDNLFYAVKEMDCMVMPFRLVDIVKAVDPVKLYEYISWQKKIVAIDYPEIRSFSKFIWTYTNVEDYCSLLTQLWDMPEPFFSEEEAVCFLEKNNWLYRVEEILQLLEEKTEIL